MHITQESDYAVRIVYCLAKCGTRRDARGISEEHTRRRACQVWFFLFLFFPGSP